MFISRRNILRIAAGAILGGAKGSQPNISSQDNVIQRRYRASATITLLSIPVVSKGDVGSGFISIEDADSTTALQFGAGSYPENARGLNRLGFIKEVVTERSPGEVSECAYFAFMTTSAEKSIEQAKRALDTPGETIPYAVAEGSGCNGRFTSKLDRVNLSSHITWRNYSQLTNQIRAAVAEPDASQHPTSKLMEMRMAEGEAAPATFLYAVRTALMNGNTRASITLIYNAKEFLLRTDKVADPAMGGRFAERNLVPDASRVMLLNAHLTDWSSGVITPFRVWFEAGREHLPPLRFEYQAKSFLRLAFEFDPTVSGPPVKPALNKKENT